MPHDSTPEIQPMVFVPCEAAQRLGISEHELKALVDAKKIPIIWIGAESARFSIEVIESLHLHDTDIPKVKWRKPAAPEDHPEDPFHRVRHARKRYAGSIISWRKCVLERDSHQCRRCGCADRRVLTAHHIKHRNRNPGLSLDVENGITLCANCHRIEHLVKPVQQRKHTRLRRS